MTIEKVESKSKEVNMEFYLYRMTAECIKAGILKKQLDFRDHRFQRIEERTPIQIPPLKTSFNFYPIK